MKFLSLLRGCSRVGLVALLAMVTLPVEAAETTPKLEPKYPFRTGWANEHLPWYRLKPGEFPPQHSDLRMGGELVAADFIHRTGQFRLNKTGELRDFKLPPFGTAQYLNSEAELRDIPMGTYFLFFLSHDAEGNPNQLVTMQDQFTMDDSHSFTYRVDELKPGEGKVLVTKQSVPKKQLDLGKQELLVTELTRVWKGGKQVALSDLAAGDVLLYNRTAVVGEAPSRCTDIWAGVETHRQVTQQQREKFAASVKARGVPGWIDRVEGNTLMVTLFSGSRAAFKTNVVPEFKPGADVFVVVANDELRTWNPPVDKERSQLLEVKKVPKEVYGTSEHQLVFTVANMLEGFRKGRVVRVFATGWPIKDQAYGESLMGYGFARQRTDELRELPPKEYPAQFPFRTDYGNAHLPWYQLVPGKAAPRYAEHLMLGELVKVDATTRTGQFRQDRTGELVDFTLVPPPAPTLPPGAKGKLPPVASTVRYLNADVDLADLPTGVRYRFNMFVDEQGKFTRTTFISDEFSLMATNVLTYRIEQVDVKGGKLQVGRRIPEVKDYNGDMQQPPDVARTELRVDSNTRIWKDGEMRTPGDLKPGDLLLVNLTSESPGKPAKCTDIWVGEDAQKWATETQAKKKAPVKQ